MSNPFAISMVRMRVPPHMGSFINVSGFEIKCDDNGIIEVPKSEVTHLLAHGLTMAADVEAATPGKPQRVGQVSGGNR